MHYKQFLNKKQQTIRQRNLTAHHRNAKNNILHHPLFHSQNMRLNHFKAYNGLYNIHILLTIRYFLAPTQIH